MPTFASLIPGASVVSSLSVLITFAGLHRFICPKRSLVLPLRWTCALTLRVVPFVCPRAHLISFSPFLFELTTKPLQSSSLQHGTLTDANQSSSRETRALGYLDELAKKEPKISF